jgi:hypothetical protein
MHINLFLIPAFVFIGNFSFGQVKDSMGFSIKKVASFEVKNDLYEVRILNERETPICIMHSTYINLFWDPPQRLAIMKNDQLFEVFSVQPKF